jgi:hypothetical protein
MRAFYEDLPLLHLIVPPVLLQDGHEKEKAKHRKAKEEEEAAANATETADDEEDTTDVKVALIFLHSPSFLHFSTISLPYFSIM